MSSRTRPGRRRIASILGATALAATGVMLAPPAGAHDHPVLPPGDYTEEQTAYAEQLVHEAEQILPAKFADASSLAALGFYDFGVPTPNGYWHYINPSYFNDGHILDANYPESLVYKSGPNGTRVLEAAMYFVDPGTTLETIPEDIAWLPGWHQHPELCTNSSGKFSGITRPDGTCAVGTPGVGPPMAHVWIVDNECGHRFAGLGVTGTMCDPEGGHGHEPGTPPGHGHEPPPSTPPGTPPVTPPPSTPPAAPPTAPPSGAPVAPPATPVPGTPDYTG